MDIVVWLRSLGLGRYEAAFRENEIDETVLPSLTHETLRELGVTAVGHRLKLLDAIALLRTDGSAKAPLAEARSRHRRAPPSHRDVLRPRRFDGTLGPYGPRGLTRSHLHLSEVCCRDGRAL